MPHCMDCSVDHFSLLFRPKPLNMAIKFYSIKLSYYEKRIENQMCN